ncbi:uncharacterized protein LOC117320840 [Pecten maximus]|uniref:uncharacterized protein LOC117320840 n=1 Tax=Pecten maximus TaxID=6579 RepID=UPI0014582D94|nr:uncharacterized protein LOC117320840 [Pecten maximus]
MLRPVTYFEDGPWELHMQNVDTRYKRLQEDGLSTFAACPGQITVLVGGELKLEFISYIPDGFNTYYLDIYGTAHDSGLIPEKASLEMFYGRTYYGVLFYFNELSVTLKLWQVICADHMKSFSLALGTTGRTISEHFHSLPNVIGRYEGFSSGGDFRENSPAIVNLRIHLGCRPQKLKINVNGSYLAETYNITEDESTGEKMFSKSFSFPKISMIDNGTTVFLHSSFIDDQGFPRNISIEQTIRVVPGIYVWPLFI